MLKYILAILFFAALTFLPAFSQTAAPPGPESVFTVELKDGRSVQVTELVEKRREKIHWANILRAKRGRLYRAYKTFGLSKDYPLRIYADDYKANKAVLKMVPDRRSPEEKHPKAYWTRGQCVFWGPVVQVGGWFLINGIQAFNAANN